MKKILFLFILVFFPLTVMAAGTDAYYIEANVLSNGDMEVKELKILSGEFNGMESTIRYSNSELKYFTGEQADFEGSTIYNASGIEDVKIYGVEYNNSSKYDALNNPNRTEFTENNYAQNGDYGYYSKSYDTYRIYIPSSYGQASLITYTLKDVVVIHNDIAEIAWDFIGPDYNEVIDELIITINLPANSDELRVFSHGPLTGSNDIVSRDQVQAVYTNFGPYQQVDVRVVFDKNIVPQGSKFSNVDGLEKILIVEELRANKANDLRKEAQGKLNLIKVYFFIDFYNLFIN